MSTPDDGVQWFTPDIPMDEKHFRKGTVHLEGTHFWIGTLEPGVGVPEERVLCLARNPEKVPKGVDFAVMADNRADQITCWDCLFELALIGETHKHRLKIVKNDNPVTDFVSFLCRDCSFWVNYGRSTLYFLLTGI